MMDNAMNTWDYYFTISKMVDLENSEAETATGGYFVYPEPSDLTQVGTVFLKRAARRVKEFEDEP